MVKGITKQVVVVHCPETRYFDQAIFLVRDESLMAAGSSPEQVLREACRAADGYLRQHTEPRSRGRVSWLLCGGIAGLGILAAIAVWLL